MAPSSGPPANHDGSGADPIQDQPAVTLDPDDFDYKIWQEGSRTNHVKCFNNTGAPPEKDESTGMYTQYIKLESPFPFQVLHTKTFADGPIAGCQAVVVKPEIPFPFMKLPREIRDEIYAHAMAQGTFPSELVKNRNYNDGIIRFRRFELDSVITYKHQKRFRTNSEWPEYLKEYLNQKQSLTPGLLTTSRQVYHESLPILYGANVFEMDASYELPSIFTQIGNSRGCLRKLRLDRFWSFRSIGKHLEPLTHLKQLYIDRPMFWDSAHTARVFFDKAYRWIRGVASEYGDEVHAANLVTIYCDEECPQHCDRTKQSSMKECIMKESFQSELKAIILARKSVSFPFTKLPRKVRDKVYSHAMVFNPFSDPDDEIGGTLHIEFDENNNPRREIRDWYVGADRPDGWRQDSLRWSESLTSGLLSANRQIYQEAVQILYGENEFDLNNYEAAEAWLDRIGISHIYLRNVDIGDSLNNRNIFYKLLHVDRLQISIADTYQYEFSSGEYVYGEANLKSPEEAADAFFARAGHWIESAGSFRGGRAAAIDRIHPFGPLDGMEEEQWVSRFRKELKSVCG